MDDLPSRLTLLASHLEKKAKLSDALSDDHAANKESAEALRMKRRAENARRFATDCVHAAKLLTAKAKRAAFAPPTLNEALKHGSLTFPDWPFSDIAAWWNHFESVGWKVGSGKPMIDWKAAAANGFRNWQEKHPEAAPAKPNPKLDPIGWVEFLAAQGRPYKDFRAEQKFVQKDFEEWRKKA